MHAILFTAFRAQPKAFHISAAILAEGEEFAGAPILERLVAGETVAQHEWGRSATLGCDDSLIGNCRTELLILRFYFASASFLGYNSAHSL
jgi:hypothetical protein